MIFDIPRLIEHISSIMTLEVGFIPPYIKIDSQTTFVMKEGDVILTGTPSGVGPVVPGDKVACQLSRSASDGGEELISLEFEAVQREGGYRFQPE